MTRYKGFEIGRYFDIFKNGKHLFTASWQRCCSLEEAKQTIDTSLAFQRLPNKQAALSSLSCELESGTEERDRQTEQVNNYFTNQLYEDENQY